MSKTPKLSKKIIITGKIIAESGIMVGASNSAMEIGGIDKQVIRNPITKIPYIPGSSLKGKMRSLFELNNGTLSTDSKLSSFGPTHNPAHVAARLFGHIKHEQNNRKSQQPSRLIVRDASLTEKSQEELKNHTTLYTETKAENSIDRITSEANPRFFERVPAGAEFELNMVLNVFMDEQSKEENYLNDVFNALKLVQDDYLGGCGSRGNGQVRFVIDSIEGKSLAFYNGTNPKAEDLNNKIPAEFKKTN
ncbi:MAG TPA: type III-A CRISPR-associated RAMP protein Csm3 [Chitinophagales bacterium]|nr:type III-A CRISPR-associated RAMP protein Csm3 [Chitinophagales bacterium]